MTTLTHKITPNDMRIIRLLHDWHEAGRAEFERTYLTLDYDTYQPHTARDSHRKYLYLDEKTSGVFLLDKMTGDIWRSKAYGVKDPRKFVGRLDQVNGLRLVRARDW